MVEQYREAYRDLLAARRDRAAALRLDDLLLDARSKPASPHVKSFPDYDAAQELSAVRRHADPCTR